ncbi:hypothetical protein P2Q00_12495 [Streptomyces coacervatus]|nr:hypothetical protein [Streptomyces coacervatus]MDF2266251.1 hypothetical protein [Streptomyces coacervatus]
MLLPPVEVPRTQIIERTRHCYEDIHRLLEKRGRSAPSPAV